MFEETYASNADVRISTVAERGEPEIERLFHEHLIDRRIEVERLQVQRDADLTELLSQRLREPLLIRGVRERDGKPLAIPARLETSLVQQLTVLGRHHAGTAWSRVGPYQKVGDRTRRGVPWLKSIDDEGPVDGVREARAPANR